MVDIEYIIASALSAFEDAGFPMARAVLVAVGIDPAAVAPRRPRPHRAGAVVSVATAREIEACMANRESPMDGRVPCA